MNFSRNDVSRMQKLYSEGSKTGATAPMAQHFWDLEVIQMREIH